MTNAKLKPPSSPISEEQKKETIKEKNVETIKEAVKSFSAEDMKRKWNTQAHKVDVIVHTPHGAINMNSQIMTMPQIEELRGSLRTKITNPHGYLDMKMTDGFLLIPHELLVSSVIQVLIDAVPPEPPLPTPGSVVAKKKAPKPPRIPPPEKA